GGRNPNGKPEARATVSEAGRVYTNVSVQLKGYTTFRPIDRLPSLTLDFNKFVPKQKFHGLTKVSLNNSLQDPPRLHEKFSRELFAAANVPVPRSDYALVTLNGRDLGLYVLTEGFDKSFLKRHFARADGTLYEGGILRDIDQSFSPGSGKNAKSDAAVQNLITASREPDVEQRHRALEAILDVDQFLSMMAIETILCHSDSYSMNRNNYRLYHDPESGKLVFIPHGMDRVLGAHRSPLQLEAVPPALGLVARGFLSVPELRTRYVERIGLLFTNLFQPAELCGRVQEMDAKIARAKMNHVGAGEQFDGRMSRDSSDDADDLCRRIARRAVELKLQFANRADLLSPAPMPSFDSNGVALLGPWKLKSAFGPLVTSQVETRDGSSMLRLHTTDLSLAASMRTKATLPVGSYRLLGEIKMAGAGAPTNSIRAYIRRHSATRYAIEELRFDWRQANVSFRIVEPRAPEEIEFICEIRSSSSELWFEASALRLIREPAKEGAPRSNGIPARQF
ncbi:MAG TPA: CotH kinase family protein, partial [Methylomirabilota bacterium]|nr:CotH kinase family protein [Methylomirabilota bacterium]